MREDEMDEDTPDEPVVEQAVASSASPSKAVRQRVAEPGPGLVRPAHTSGVSLDHEAANADRGVDCLVRVRVCFRALQCPNGWQAAAGGGLVC